MLEKGPAKKVTIYVNEDTRAHGSPLHEAILAFLLQKGVAGATAVRADAGFGSHHVRHTPRIEVLAEHLPVRIEFVESVERVEALLPSLYDMVTDGLVEVQDTTVVKATPQKPAPEPPPAHERRQGPAKMMRVFLGEADRWEGDPLYDAIIKRLRMLGVAGATVYRGIDGYGAKGHIHKERFLHLSRDLPVMISAVDSPEKIAEAVTAVEAMLEDGLIVISDVEMIRLVRSHSPAQS